MAAGLKKALTRQFVHPSGLGGALAGRLMARKNRERIRLAVREMAVRPGDRLLEIGFGPGVAIEAVMSTNPDCEVIGLDSSAVMLAQARRRNDRAIRREKVVLHAVSAEDYDGGDGPFDRIFTINALPFCVDPATVVSRHVEWLNPGGRFVIVHQVPMQSVGQSALDQKMSEFSAWLEGAGLGITRQERFPAKPNEILFLEGALPA